MSKKTLVDFGILFLIIGLIMVFRAQVETVLNFLLTYIISQGYIFQIGIAFVVVACVLVFTGFRGKKEDTKKPEQMWIATKEGVNEKEFEETRRCLLTSYHFFVQTHAGYIIALIIGASVIISTFDVFFKSTLGIIFFILLLVGISIMTVLMFARIVYWTLLASVAITLTMDKAIIYFNDTNKTYTSKAPNTAIIQNAIDEQINYQIRHRNLTWYKRWAYQVRS